MLTLAFLDAFGDHTIRDARVRHLLPSRIADGARRGGAFGGAAAATRVRRVLDGVGRRGPRSHQVGVRVPDGLQFVQARKREPRLERNCRRRLPLSAMQRSSPLNSCMSSERALARFKMADTTRANAKYRHSHLRALPLPVCQIKDTGEGGLEFEL